MAVPDDAVTPLIATFTDFGGNGPYLGQMEMAIRTRCPAAAVVHLLCDAPMFDPVASAYLLAAVFHGLPPGAVLLGVVDPGVGTDRSTMAARVDGRWLVGPDNGLFELALRRATRWDAFTIAWRPGELSATFHGRDLFAPVAAQLAAGVEPQRAGLVPGRPTGHPDWPDDLAKVIYFDHYGNAWTGLRACAMLSDTVVVSGRPVRRARTFGDVPQGEAFWYENSSGLVEIAVNGGRADEMPDMGIGIEIGC